MELRTAERLEDRARDDLRHALDRYEAAQTERARQRHIRRAQVASSQLKFARTYVRELSN